jgi:Na+-transporting NADH:ubiquinone oxidoreductase subunit C
MNREGNSYTIIYATVMVVVVAAALSFASLSLKPLQTKNVEVAKKTDILRSVKIASTPDNAEGLYDKYINVTYIINSNGEIVEGKGKAFDVDLKREVSLPVVERKLPVFECRIDDGSLKYILPVRGKGLWGPLWGYIALNEDKKTIFGATFDHKGETPGLGAEISKDFFTVKFENKKILDEGKVYFEIPKGGVTKKPDYAVDAISGGTITSQGLEAMIIDCLSAYEQFLNN